MNPQASEYRVQSNYLETLLDLPWNEVSQDNFDLNHAQAVLDQDHYGLEKVKERIIEHLAVLSCVCARRMLVGSPFVMPRWLCRVHSMG